MDAIKEKYIKIILAIINVVLLMKIIRDCLMIENYNYGIVLLLIFIGFLIYELFTRVLINKKRRIIFFLAVLSLIAFLLLRKSGELFFKISNIYVDNYTVIFNAIFNQKGIEFSEFFMTFILFIPLVTSTFLALTNRFISAPTVFNIIICIISWYLVFYKLIIKNIYYLIAVIIFTLGAKEYIKRCKECRGRELKVSINFKQIIVFLILIALIVPSFIRILPQEYHGKNFGSVVSFLKNDFAEEPKKVDYEREAISSSFNMRESGYSDSNVKLGGPISINGRLVFTVISDKPYYLRGKVKNLYTGHSWENKGYKFYEKNNPMVNSEVGVASLNNAKVYKEYRGENTITIIPDKSFKTTSYFTPNGTTEIISPYEKLFMDNIPLFLTNSTIIDSYDVKFVCYGKMDSYLQGIENVESNVTLNEEKYSLPLRNYGDSDEVYYKKLEELVDTTNNELLQKYNKFKWNYIDYMQVPEDMIDENVYTLVEEILNEAAKKNRKESMQLTSEEKALAIMDFLRKNYKYTTDVRNDSYEDFVSDFVLNKKEGYCTYFASATVIMCRIAGIPSRYVEGFNMNNETSVDGEYKITNKDAHAWAEVLVNPYKDQWVVVDSVPVEEDNDNEMVLQPQEDTKVINDSDNTIKEHANPIKEEEDFSESTESREGANLLEIITIVLGSIIFIVCIIIFSYKNKVSKIIKSNSLIPLYLYTMSRLETIGIRKEHHLGDTEFVNGIKETELKIKLSYLVNSVYKEYYGDEKVNFKDSSQVLYKKEFIKYIEKYVKDNENKKINYYMRKYFQISQ